MHVARGAAPGLHAGTLRGVGHRGGGAALVACRLLAHRIEGEAHRREDRSISRRVALARFAVLKTRDLFEWNWPSKINRLQIQNLFRLNFIEEGANVIFLVGVGLGKSHLSIALGHTACQRGYSVLFATAVDIINSVNAAYAHGGLKRELRRDVKPRG
jgi:DNA replication protein DnaC